MRPTSNLVLERETPGSVLALKAASLVKPCSNELKLIYSASVTPRPCSCSCKDFRPSYPSAQASKPSITIATNTSWLGGNASDQFRSNGVSTSSIIDNFRGLDASEDEYEGVIVNPERLPTNPNAFASILRVSLSHWQLKGNKGVWLKLPVEHVDLVPVAVKEGFKYHHAEPGYVMLTYWLPKGPCMLPANASHQVGVGGFVINDKGEVLVVQEKYCSSTFSGVWKLPTGFVVESEEIFSGAIREVREETGIDTEFVEVMAIRHAHRVAFEKSDLFFVCLLRPLSTQIIVDELEIQAAKWMPLSEFVEQPFYQGDSMFKKVIEICIARLSNRYHGLLANEMVSEFEGKPSFLYYNVI
ncbi:hypothetical protein AMTRI_Chr13g115890 [Amborella trichopoda]|uniref:nudix hydrolase 8 n=1 Tax=Amborella trichopoda TaxID=13333 RepID=UPI0005D337D8|nr:nudix hydrolase 8 [Amborella trichopoda]|eukprot:XP_011621187.1 nudix hydrolase 8 [Amborella trichopoda]